MTEGRADRPGQQCPGLFVFRKKSRRRGPGRVCVLGFGVGTGTSSSWPRRPAVWVRRPPATTRTFRFFHGTAGRFVSVCGPRWYFVSIRFNRTAARLDAPFMTTRGPETFRADPNGLESDCPILPALESNARCIRPHRLQLLHSTFLNGFHPGRFKKGADDPGVRRYVSGHSVLISRGLTVVFTAVF